MMEAADPIAVLGGSGALGSGLARRWANAGHQIIIGSRDEERAARAADAINDAGGHRNCAGGSYIQAAENASVIVVAVPFAVQLDVLREIARRAGGKIVIDCTVPLVPPKVGTIQLPTEGSAAERARLQLGVDVRLVSAFQNVSAKLLAQDDRTIDCDVLVSGDDERAREVAIHLAAAAGLRAFHAGPLANAAAAEGLTSVLIQLNRRYGVTHAGIRLTGLPE